jgi:hypothetical protein
VHDQNAEASRLNRDQADMSASCGTRSYYRSDSRRDHHPSAVNPR